ncbi:class I SAM-dependent methyltransferase [Oharaeibacter diazotrophicus]|uniref:Putative nicotinamide N-methyase n=1 Tax=Oharaeibacter diazotrophicus TaxID=1920512 RepID=A0A4R6RLI2_9HYPH|nr:50S ribosomal protein L11 methyltransferase [Oharaeibacter diazotrophicus]TDP87390.1 putative nicotinamide N-methyase [Oharaeibacter diazotrophicus]BBE70667.1 ribosomal protein L11 methyltransferase [Pleomorphomonas sp. SM30]GLS77413.1 ribosomal protein L11 methyltransferase [Oharaeibacter diazotrophicus]
MDVEAFITARLPAAAHPLVPEIALHAAVPSSGLGRLAAADPAFPPPYWARPWPGGLVLARHLLDHPVLAADRRVLDFGAGGGVAALAAARAGAAEVVALDADSFARAAVRANARRAGLAVATAAELPAGHFDLVVAGDVFYDAAVATAALAALTELRCRGARVLVGDPGRDHLPWARLTPLATYVVAEWGASAGTPGTATVHAFDGAE